MGLILLADDDDDDQMLFKMAFSLVASNFTLATVSNGLQVLNYLETARHRLPSLIVLDYNMPQLNGADVIRAVYKQPHCMRIPIIVFSTCGADHTVKRCLAEGAVRCFTKPNNMHQLIATTEEILTFCC